ncbi:hypothetical protein [Bacillus cereus group sp. BfR-BA-01445]|uniref:hypothetical protein n=1 Tax=Bacillus cereus group sp. BfR-BA-01445 TaxID=2920349 RepID=UPI001F5ADEDF|nr:hypothetical protein [Bacillus cereus group sp. BfR-BA-01445]
MAYLGNKTEGQLKRAYDNTNDRSERRKITREMKKRGKERCIISGWQDIAVEEEYSSDPFNYDNVPKFLGALQGIASIFLMWQTYVIFAIAWFAYRLIQYPLDHYFQLAEQYFPAQYYMESNIVGNKIQMNIVGFMVACGITIILFKFGRSIRKITALVFVLMSIYFLVDEIRMKDVPVYAMILSGLVIIIAVAGAVKIKKCFLLGVWMIISTTLGFIIIGNHIVKPWVLIETAGFLLMFVKGNVFTITKKNTKTATEFN